MLLGSVIAILPVFAAVPALGAVYFGLQDFAQSGALGAALDWAESVGVPVCRDCNPWLPVA